MMPHRLRHWGVFERADAFRRRVTELPSGDRLHAKLQ